MKQLQVFAVAIALVFGLGVTTAKESQAVPPAMERSPWCYFGAMSFYQTQMARGASRRLAVNQMVGLYDACASGGGLLVFARY